MRDRHSLAWPLVLFAALAVLYTWPQAIRLDAIPDNTDAYFNLWRLSWIAHQLPSNPARLFDANIFHPEPLTFAYSDAVLVQGALTLPFIRAGVPVVYAYNALVLLSFVLSGLAMFLCARWMTGDTRAAVLAGAAYAFAPFRFDHYYHLEMLCAWWVPLVFWTAHRTVDRGRLRDGLALGALIVLQTLSSLYYGVFLCTLLPILVVPLLLARPADERRRALVALGAGALLVAVIVLPYSIPYWEARAVVGERRAGNGVLFGAGPGHYLATMPGNRLEGWLTAPLGRPEKRLNPGFVVMALTLVALWPPWTRRTAVYGGFLACAVILSAGPAGYVYSLLRETLPVYRGFRVPARFGQFALAAFCVLAAMGAVRLRTWLAARGWPANAILTVLVIAGCSEYLMRPLALVPVPTAAPAAYAWLRDQPAGVVAEFPMPTRVHLPLYEGQFEFLSTFHWHPLINGYSGTWSGRHVSFLDTVAGFPDDAAMAALRARDVTYLVIHERYYGAARYQSVRDALDRRAGLEVLGRFDDGGTEVAIYRMRPRAS